MRRSSSGADLVVLCIAVEQTGAHTPGRTDPYYEFARVPPKEKKNQFSRGAGMSKIRGANGSVQCVLAAAVPSSCDWPLVERRRNDRRKSDRRQQDGARPPESALHASKVVRSCTPRERQVLTLLVQGMTNKQIAQILGIAEDTVKKHLHHVYRKLDVHRRALLMIGVPTRSWGDTSSVE